MLRWTIKFTLPLTPLENNNRGNENKANMAVGVAAVIFTLSKKVRTGQFIQSIPSDTKLQAISFELWDFGCGEIVF